MRGVRVGWVGGSEWGKLMLGVLVCQDDECGFPAAGGSGSRFKALGSVSVDASSLRQARAIGASRIVLAMPLAFRVRRGAVESFRTSYYLPTSLRPV